MKCKQCHQEFTPKQQFCSDKCRVRCHRGHTDDTKSVEAHTSGVDPEDVTVEPENYQPSWE